MSKKQAQQKCWMVLNIFEPDIEHQKFVEILYLVFVS